MPGHALSAGHGEKAMDKLADSFIHHRLNNHQNLIVADTV